MASRVVTYSLHVLEILLYVRGYHAYKDNWNPVIGKTLGVRREPTNMIDKHAVAVVKDSVIVGHIPYDLAPVSATKCEQILRGSYRRRVKQGCWQEVPCIYRLYGPKIYVDKMKELVDGMFADGYV